MEILNAILLGVVQGVTEFLPISSSGHLVLIPVLTGFKDQGLAVDALLHLSTALAIIIYFRWRWWRMVKNFRSDDSLKKIIVASLPAALAGILLDGLVETYLRSPWVVMIMLIAVGGLMWWVEENHTVVRQVGVKDGKNEKSELAEVGWPTILLVGLAQPLALINGTSRSGITILTGMWQNLSRRKAAELAFLLGMPVTLGAGLFKLPRLFSLQPDWTVVLTAAVTAFISALVAIRWMLRFLRRKTLKPFVVYRVLLAVAVAVLLLTRG